MSYEEWVEIGIKNGWIGPLVCVTHDGIPMSSEEENAWDTEDPCIWIFRRYESPEHQASIEEEHPPSTWRK